MASTVHPIDTPQVLEDINKIPVLSDEETSGVALDAKDYSALLDLPSNASIKEVYPSRTKLQLTAEQLAFKKNQEKYEARKIMKNFPAYLNLTTTYLRVIYILSERILIQGNKNSEITFNAEETVYQNGSYMRSISTKKFTYKDLRILFDLTLKDRVSAISRIYNNSRKRITASRTALNDPVYMTTALHNYLTTLVGTNYAGQLQSLSQYAQAAIGIETDPSTGQAVFSKINSRLVINNIIRRAYAVNPAASGKDIYMDESLQTLIGSARPFAQEKKALSAAQIEANNHHVAFLDFYSAAKKQPLRASQKVQTKRIVNNTGSSFYLGLTDDEQKVIIKTNTITSSMLNSLVSCHTIGAGDFEKFKTDASIPKFTSYFGDSYQSVKDKVVASLAYFKATEEVTFDRVNTPANHPGLVLKEKIVYSATLGDEYKKLFETQIGARKARTLEEGKRRREKLKGGKGSADTVDYNAARVLPYGRA